jgi:hypothetical protein
VAIEKISKNASFLTSHIGISFAVFYQAQFQFSLMTRYKYLLLVKIRHRTSVSDIGFAGPVFSSN